jgi:hypothetical protein
MSKEKDKKPVSKDKKANKTISSELLESVRGALYKLKDYLDNIDFADEDANSDKQATTMMTIIEKMGKSFETLAVLEKKVQSEEEGKSKVRGNAKLSLLEDGQLDDQE